MYHKRRPLQRFAHDHLGSTNKTPIVKTDMENLHPFRERFIHNFRLSNQMSHLFEKRLKP
jgi:hypothetical protein